MYPRAARVLYLPVLFSEQRHGGGGPPAPVLGQARGPAAAFVRIKDSGCPGVPAMPHELPKAYDPSAIEEKWAQYWVEQKLFHLETPASAEDVFTLLLPPPNVTGRLHMGHMLNQTEMDIIIRWRRMRGQKTLWVPGTDHAGIATQMMVERRLESEGKKRAEMGREAFIERVWEWKRHYGGAILAQMKRLGASVDWEREYFTMDEGLSRAVREAFVRLHKAGMIYRGAYIVNWCPRCVTAISDLEVVHEEVQGKLYEIHYPLADGSGRITVATTRPETMLGDVAIAVNPDDQRYRSWIGKSVLVPLMGREIPIIADDWANPEFGTGAVKVTPAHDPNDFAIGRRHHLPQIDILNEHARLNENAGAYQGLDRYVARKKVLTDLESQGLLGQVKDHLLNVGKCDRCKTVVEPRLSTQWFLRVQGEIAQRAMDAVEQGHIRITPENYRTIYLNWMRGIHDWCISRQLWWGHRIPAWYCAACTEVHVAREAPSKCGKCGSADLTQDSDVLDTWFSSALLPFTCFGWPLKTKDLEVFYPTSLLITGFDILFFWVARMIMMGTWFMGGEDAMPAADFDPARRAAMLKESVPFQEVYIHALVRDKERQKMSKTKGNVLDPIEITERYGTDAVRFTLASMAAPGTDIAFNEERTEGYRAFANKIWNAARFIFLHLEKAKESGAWSHDGDLTLGSDAMEDLWILSRLQATTDAVNASLAEFRFDQAASTLYSFIWGDFCDWYLELAKLRLNRGDSPEDKQVTQATLLFLMTNLEWTLRLLSPFMPFLTEEIWNVLQDYSPDNEARKKSIALAEFPVTQRLSAGEKAGLVAQGVPADLWDNLEEGRIRAERDMRIFQGLVSDIRNLRAEMKLEPRLKVPIEVHANGTIHEMLTRNAMKIQALAGVETVTFVDGSIAKKSNSRVSADYEVRITYEKPIDVAAERERLSKELKKLETELANAQRNLANENFLAKAPDSVVEGIRKREAELKVLIEKSRSALAGLG
jgi:valyl-tRNA synthetase